MTDGGASVVFTISIGSLITFINLLIKYRKFIRRLFVKDEKKVMSNLIKESLRLLNVYLKKYLDQVSESGDPQAVLSFMQELKEKFQVQFDKKR
jgi:hypothetical protein